jgi:uncharacterized protein YybS (DUF2232 family)
MIETLIYFLISLLILLLFFFAMDGMFLTLLRRGKKWKFILTAGFIYCIVIITPFLIMTKKATGSGLVQYAASEMQKNMDLALADAQKKGATPEEIAVIKTSTEIFLIKPFAAWAIVSVLFMVFLNYFVVRLYALKKYNITDEMPPFELWFLDEKIIWALLACLFTVLFQNVIKNALIQDIAYNGIFVLANVYFAAGLAVCAFMFVKYKVPGPVRFFFYLMIVIWSFLMALLVLAGILDTWFNFRKIEKGGTIWR